jgi:hypothetical protein
MRELLTDAEKSILEIADMLTATKEEDIERLHALNYQLAEVTYNLTRKRLDYYKARISELESMVVNHTNQI